MRYAGAPSPSELYTKGGFDNIMFAKFNTVEDRDAATAKIRAAKLTLDKPVWASADLPLSGRVLRSIVFGTKRLFLKWGFAKSVLWVDTDTQTLQFGGEAVFKAAVSEGKLVLSYGEGWEDDGRRMEDAVRRAVRQAPARRSWT